MAISLSREAQRFVEEEMRRGGYPTVEDTVVAGIHALQQQEEALTADDLEELRAEIQIGVEQADRGELHDGEDVFQKFKDQLEARRHGT